MSDETQNQSADPFDMPAGAIDTSFPLLSPDRICRFEIVSSTIGPSRNNEASETWTIKHKLLKDATSTAGEPIKAGFPVTIRMGITPTEAHDGKDAYTAQMIARNVAARLQGIFGKDTKVSPRQLFADPKQIEGKIVEARVGVQKDKSGQFPDSNTLTYVQPV